jgi:hypothetical protein
MDIVVKSLHDRHFGTPVPLFKRLGGRLIPKNSVFLRRIEKVGLAPKWILKNRVNLVLRCSTASNCQLKPRSRWGGIRIKLVIVALHEGNGLPIETG